MSIVQFRRDYQLAPILLVNGIAARQPYGQMSILALTEGSDSVNYPNESDYFAHFDPLPGGTLIDFSAAEYPFASMAMAANAMVQNPLKISLRMKCPPRAGVHSYSAAQATLTRLGQQLKSHILAGGTFTVATPGMIYENCLLKSVRDISSAGDKIVQDVFQFDFEQPLITQQQGEAVYNNLYNKLANGLPASNPPANSGVANVLGNAATNQPPTPVQNAAAAQ